MASDSRSHSDLSGGAVTKQAACLNCRKSKMKCHRSHQSSVCTKCQRNGIECVVPDYHIGRQKGVKKCLSHLSFCVEEAVRKSQMQKGNSQPELSGLDLQDLLTKTRNVQSDGQVISSASGPVSAIPHQRPRSLSCHSQSGPEAYLTADSVSKQPLYHHADTGDLAGAENPLQLLAQTSELMESSTMVGHSIRSTSIPQAILSNGNSTLMAKSNGIDNFFGPFRPELDVAPDLDPIEIGLVTLSEADALFDFFFQNLAHTRWGVDPVIHTTAFVRSRSAFLLTSICAASALFIPSAAALSRRLSIHCRKLAQDVILHRHRSVEIVFAFMVNIPWMPPGEHWADDESCTYLSMALTIAMDLSLHKVIRSSSQQFQLSQHDRIANADCINARKALDLDGFGDVEETSSWGKRLLRRRERAWLALFVLERGFCLARGRQYTMLMTPLVETCDNWHKSDLADIWDESIVSVSVLRRELEGLLTKVREVCDAHQASQLDASSTVLAIKRDIDGFFDRWYFTWPSQIGNRPGFHLPPYVDILASHTRLSLYTSVINHPTAPLEAKHFFRAGALASALNVMRASVQGESQLQSMPNNTAIMISFAACVALELSSLVNGTQDDLASSVQNLIGETADVLERIGSTPLHRDGASVLFARQIRLVAQRSSVPKTREETVQWPSGQMDNGSFASDSHNQEQVPTHAAGHSDHSVPSASSDPMLFSGMSNDEIINAIENTGMELDMSWADLPFGNGPNLDWLDWPT